MRISIVIATKDRAGYLDRALASFEAQAGAPTFEVIVVDNGSCDDTARIAQRYAERAAFPVRYLYEPEPNRGQARNRGIAEAAGSIVLFCDDDVQAPPGFVAAHEAAHRADNRIVNGPILNVASYDDRPGPSFANYSRAFLCTCNASAPRDALLKVGGFDEAFNLYGWEDTELGVRLRAAGLRWTFAWDAFVWHIKPPAENTLTVETRKTLERARMARRFLAKHPSQRARMATGAYAINVWRGKYLLPDGLVAFYAGLASGDRVPGWIRALARAQLLDGLYTRELRKVLRGDEPS